MKIDDIRQKCWDFSPEYDLQGNISKCKFFDKKLCKLYGENATVRCKLFEEPQEEARQEIKQEANQEIKQEDQNLMMFSFSRVSLFDKCPFSYYLKYVLNIEPPTVQKWKLVGRSYHEAVHSISLGEEIKFESTGDVFEDAKIRALVTALKEELRPPEKSILETKLDIKFGDLGFVIRLIPDRYDVETKTLVEYKTSSDVEAFSILSVAYQLSLYKFAQPDAEKFAVYAIQKPKQRPKKDEKPDDFESRVFEDISDDVSKYLKIINFGMNEVDVRRCQDEFFWKIQEIMKAHEKGTFYRRPQTCATREEECEYRNICISKL